MSARSKSQLAREHLTRASDALAAGDLVVAVTFLHLSAEAAVVAVAAARGIETERQHRSKAQAARELHAQGVVPDDLSPILELLNQARKDASYEGEDPDLGGQDPALLVARVEVVVQVAEEMES